MDLFLIYMYAAITIFFIMLIHFHDDTTEVNKSTVFRIGVASVCWVFLIPFFCFMAALDIANGNIDVKAKFNQLINTAKSMWAR